MASVEVRDAVHGFIELSPEEWAVVDTRAFQRLRGVQQLAMTNLVYPGARHSRFEHCIGASSVASRLSRSVQSKGYAIDERLARLGGLVHDIGHGPFSHVSEFVFEKLSGRDHVHEQMSAGIVRHDPQVRAALGGETAERIANLLTETGDDARRSVERDFVAGPSDVDKFDYLLRDSHYCGVDYGRYDLPKVIEAAKGIEIPGGGSTLAFRADGIYALEGMLLARYHMHRQVYGHKTRIATDRMLVRAMLLGVQEGVLPSDVFAPPSEISAEFVVDYLGWDDAEVIKRILGSSGPAEEMMRALVERQLMKRVVRLSFEELEAKLGRVIAGYAATVDADALEEHVALAEERIAALLGVKPFWVVLNWETQSNPIARRYSQRLGKGQVLLVSDDDPPVPFDELSEVFGEGDVPARDFVSVYARCAGDTRPDPAVEAQVRELSLELLGDLGQRAAEV